MKYQKIALISKNEISSWKSCQHITNNLAKSYVDIFKTAEVEFFKVSEDLSLFLAIECAKKIKSKNCDLVIWLDHKPNAAIFLEALGIVFAQTEFILKPKFLIHLFGDFVLDCLGWEAVEESLKNYPVHFVVASERQKLLVDLFFSGKKSHCTVSPFPVNEEIFNVEKMVDNREKYRAKLEASDSFVILYSGRISYQKNVDKIVKIFKSLDSFSEKKIQFWIAGPWDDILLPYAGIKGVPGSYYSQFMTSIKEMSVGVKFLGQLEPSELLSVYHAADLFMSLSTFNDEDYGMAIAEALVSGLPCLLSDWGGFSSFANYSPNVEFIQVELDKNGPEVNMTEARKKLMKHLLSSQYNVEERRQNSKTALSYLSIDANKNRIALLLSELHFTTIDKCNPIFYKMCALFKMNPQAPFKDRNSQLSDFYKEIYKNYVSN
jgi:glycosyltransferase involved in cell wall biosynthesis